MISTLCNYSDHYFNEGKILVREEGLGLVLSLNSSHFLELLVFINLKFLN